MKNFNLVSLLFMAALQFSLPAQGTPPMYIQEGHAASPTPTKSHNSKAVTDQQNDIGKDTLSENNRVKLFNAYQLLDRSPILNVETHEGQRYSGSKNGISFWDGYSKLNFTVENSGIPENNVTALAVDEQNNLWIGTHNKGIVKGFGNTFKPFKTKVIPTQNLFIYSIIADNNGGMWVTFQDGGFEYFLLGNSIAYFPGTASN